MPLTAHFIGGCTIGDSPETGVVDAYQRMYGHPGLHVVDGSAISANLGVNPSLTITAQAERAMAFWPNKGEPDERPALGAAYAQVAPVEPKNPVVPVEAPAAPAAADRRRQLKLSTFRPRNPRVTGLVGTGERSGGIAPSQWSGPSVQALYVSDSGLTQGPTILPPRSGPGAISVARPGSALCRRSQPGPGAIPIDSAGDREP